MDQGKPQKTNFGYKVVWAETEDYSSTFLVFEKPSSTDMFFETDRDKTWFVNSGQFKVKWIDTSKGQAYEQQINAGQAFHVEKFKPVQLVSLTNDSSVTEVSNKSCSTEFVLSGNN